MKSVLISAPKQAKGFSLVELISVIVIVGILAAVVTPKFINFSRASKVASLENIAGSMRSSISLVKAAAISQGLRISTSSANQETFLVDFGGQSSEVDWRNLCPESQAELGDQLSMLDFINLNEASGLQTQLSNQYTLIGYDIPNAFWLARQGCYILYDSFATPSCTVTVVTEDC